MTMSVFTSVSRRLEEAATLGGAPAAGDDFGAFLQGVGDVGLDLRPPSCQ
jgi:hypothetical protein